jgi:hypothetical protein
LPEADDILNDPDLACVKEQEWFVEFMEMLSKKMAEADLEDKEVVAVTTPSKWVLVERESSGEEIVSD